MVLLSSSYLRSKSIDILKVDGMQGIKAFSREMRNERRLRPDTVLEIKRSVYGIPDAGQAFSMFMQSLHIKNVGWYRVLSIPVYTTRYGKL